MAIIKCKMCGGDLVLIQGQSIAECEYCGTRQTVPAADNVKKLTLFARAGQLRAACEFDKASGIYEAIAAEFPREAESYWGLVLCKYGIEYVDDPATGKKIPTCHRTSFTAVPDDSDFLLALEHADPQAQAFYRREAQQIEQIRQGILAVSSSEQPYDIFICYKETDARGNRTVDSLLAQDIYDALTARGYRVFFSRITLKDKLGQAYEPYIFGALNSARIMLAVGTCYEHYHAVWVKNEWSRYLKIITQDKGKYLIPCYKNMNTRDIPKEFSHLQGQDLGKVGAIADLLRGIEKLLQNTPRQPAGTVTVQSLLKRAYLFLEDADWDSAGEYCEKVLVLDPKNAEAWLGKLLAEFQIPKAEALSACTADITASRNYQKALLLGDARIRNILTDTGKSSLPDSAGIPSPADSSRPRKSKKPILMVAALALLLISLLLFWKPKAPVQKEAALPEAATEIREELQESIPIPSNTIPPEEPYQEALALAESGQYGKAAIAFGKLDGYKDARERSFQMWEHVPGRNSVSLWTTKGIYIVHALRQDGTVAVDTDKADRFSEKDIAAYYTAGYQDIVSIHGLVGLKYDGTLALPDPHEDYSLDCNGHTHEQIYLKNLYQNHVEKHREVLSGWTDLVALSVCTVNEQDCIYVGLKSNGTVVSSGTSEEIARQLHTWKDLIAVSVSDTHVIGLKADGTVVVAGSNEDGQCDVSDWTDIKAILAADVTVGSSHHPMTFGLKTDGTVLSAGSNYTGAVRNVPGWKGIRALVYGEGVGGPLGIREDGTVVASSGSSNAIRWSNITDAATVGTYSVGVTEEGALVFHPASGSFARAKNWTDILIP